MNRNYKYICKMVEWYINDLNILEERISNLEIKYDNIYKILNKKIKFKILIFQKNLDLHLFSIIQKDYVILKKIIKMKNLL